MGREIKFKFVVENHGGKYISRAYTLDDNGLPDVETILEDMEGPCNCQLNESVSVCEGDCQEFFDAKVIDKIQYTGLKDKNGVEAYHHDAISSEVPSPWDEEVPMHITGEIVWENGGWWFRCNETGSENCYLTDMAFFSVIGNELLDVNR